MPRRHLIIGLAICVVVLTAALVVVTLRDDGTSTEATGTTSTSTTATSTTTTTPPTTATTVPTTVTTVAPAQPAWPALRADGVARVVRTPSGVVLAVQSRNGDGSFVATSPCGRTVTVRGEPIVAAHVVLDPGHGGNEPGAVGPSGTTEKAVNLAIAREAKRQLEAVGATVQLTRTDDYRITLRSRDAIANALDPLVYVSIHHNAEPDGPFDGPGAETYYQIHSGPSKRLAGLLVQEYRRRFSEFDVAWKGDTDAGAKYRLTSRGTDYYGILSNAEGLTTVLSEAAFITNPPEEKLLRDPEFQRVEAAAITNAIVRFVTTKDPGGGYTEPYPREEPAGSGGGQDGCVEPSFS